MTQAILFLLAALIFVPLAVRAGLGSVLGYLVAGMVIGPWASVWSATRPRSCMCPNSAWC